jgi:DNA-3-methyladenine glycosylase II
MKQVIAKVGPCLMASRGDNLFEALVRCVIGQQISTKAAKSIFERLKTHSGQTGLSAGGLQAVTDEELKACGISGPKQRTLRALTGHVVENPDLLDGIAEREDEVIRSQLTAIKGIGPWTVDMFLVFAINRADVLATGDYAIRIAIKNLFNLRTLPDPKKCLKIADVWSPYRSVACWYLWRSLDPENSLSSSVERKS